MQHICVAAFILIVTIYLKSVFGSLLANDNQSESNYRLNYQSDLSKIKELLQSSNSDINENWSDSELYRNEENTVPSSQHENKISNSMPENVDSKFTHFRTTNDEVARLMWNLYISLLQKKLKTVSEEENKEQYDFPKHEKRALTMLSRWKPFRITGTNSGNGRHVIRSPFTSRSDPNSYNRIQIMGRPFRWG